MSVKSVIRALSPPILWDAARAARDAIGKPEWEWVPGGWDRSRAAAQGWEDESVLETLRARWPAIVAATRGPAPLTLSPESALAAREDIATHNTVMVFGYGLARAAHGVSQLSMLDWGGGLGHYRLVAEALLPDVTIEYHCRDTRLVARYARTLQPDAHFHEDDESCFARSYDLVFASAALHYVEDWRSILGRLAAASRRYLLVTRLPTVEHAPSYVALQRAHRHGFRTEYLGWVIRRDEFLEHAAQLGLTLEREFLIDERPHIPRAPGPCRYRGFLFRAARS